MNSHLKEPKILSPFESTKNLRQKSDLENRASPSKEKSQNKFHFVDVVSTHPPTSV
jgi:hypothetical protein